MTKHVAVLMGGWSSEREVSLRSGEACAKALGTGLRRGVFWRDMGVVNLRSGQPTLALTGGAAARLAEMTPPGHKAVIHLSMTDDAPYAQAFVIIEAVPEA
jgi:holo-[acyl-carrier protein] synthase